MWLVDNVDVQPVLANLDLGDCEATSYAVFDCYQSSLSWASWSFKEWLCGLAIG